MGDVPVRLTIEAPASKKEKAFTVMDAAFNEARRLENSVSEWRKGSQASLLNRNAGKAIVPVDGDMTAILVKAREISDWTGGAFDITFASKKRGVSYQNIIILPELGLAYLRPGVRIGVSGIAKGYIVDAISRILRKAGFKRFLVDAGDLYAAGKWEIGVRDPRRPESREEICKIEVKDRAVSTSGQYERGAHIIDPRTRRPVAAPLAGVTVIAEDSTTADALATAFFVLGPEESGKVIERHPGIKALFVRSGTSSPPRCAPLPSWKNGVTRRSWRRSRDTPTSPDTGRRESHPLRDSRWASAAVRH
jgi:thiamine biosynthesis lipoprotein